MTGEKSLMALKLGQMNRLSALAFFAICAVVDFVCGCVKWRSVAAGLAAIVDGFAVDHSSLFCFQSISEGQHGRAPHLTGETSR